MKKIKPQIAIVLLSFLLFLFSCKKDILTTVSDETINSNKQSKESLTVQKVSYKDFLKTVRSEHLGTLKEVLFRSEVTGGVNNFSVKVNSEPDMMLLMDQIKKVKTNNFTTYTIPLANKSNNLKEFKNLLISEKGDETLAILITYKPDATWLKAYEKGLYVPFHGKIARKVIDLKANKSVSKAGGISIATVFCQIIQVMAPVAVSCIGTGSNQHWPGQPCELDGQSTGPHYEFVTRLVQDCQDDGAPLPPEIWRRTPVVVTPQGPIVHPPTEPTPPPPPCLAGIDGTCDGSTPPPPPPISLSQFLINELSIVDSNHQLLLNSNSSLQSLIFVYAQSSGYEQENKNFVYGILDYFLNNQNVDVNEFKNNFFTISAGKDGEYDAQFWENPNLVFQLKSLPSLQEFITAFPKIQNGNAIRNLPADSVYDLVGGEILLKHQNDPANYSNACALRCSRALNYSQNAIEEFILNGIPITKKGSDNKNYILSAKAFNIYMNKTYGAPTSRLEVTSTTTFQDMVNFLISKSGIYSMVTKDRDKAGFTGHADLIYNGQVLAGPNLDARGGINFIEIWELN